MPYLVVVSEMSVRRFSRGAAIAIKPMAVLSTLGAATSGFTGFDDLPLCLGQVIFTSLIICVRLKLARMPDQRRACLIFSWAYCCLACVFICGPIYVAPRVMDIPTLPKSHWMSIVLLCTVHCFLMVHVGIAFALRCVVNACMVVGVACMPRPLTEIGDQALEALYMCAGILAGEIFGLAVENHINEISHAQDLRHAHHLAEVERKSYRVINHTSKRVMSNTAQCCELLVKKLRPYAAVLGNDGSEIVQLLHTTRAQSVSGFHMCRSLLLQAAVIRGEHHPGHDSVVFASLLEDLGLSSHAHVDSSQPMQCKVVRTDELLLKYILFNAVQNALSHGEAQGLVTVEAHVTAGHDGIEVLRVVVGNRPGENHQQLLAAVQAGASNDLLLESASGALRGGILESMGVGGAQSTFLGLAELRVFAQAFHPPADIHLWVRPSDVLFELRVTVTAASAPASTTSGIAKPDSPSLPEGLAFVCCDDDEMPRLFAPLLLAAAAASEESVVLGETHDEVAGLVARIVDLERRLGQARVVCILDQNLDSYDQGGFLGVTLVREMRNRGVKCLLIIQSANDELQDEREYLAAGADGTLGKAVKGGAGAMLSVISRLWWERFGEEAVR